MKTDFKRREFISKCMMAGAACCAIAYCPAAAAQNPAKKQDVKPDPKNLEYCGYKCPDDCPMKKGTLENNMELKKKACTVRACVIEKGYDCCIQCNELAKCDKELWSRFPEFKETVIKMQKKYLEA